MVISILSLSNAFRWSFFIIAASSQACEDVEAKFPHPQFFKKHCSRSSSGLLEPLLFNYASTHTCEFIQIDSTFRVTVATQVQSNNIKKETLYEKPIEIIKFRRSSGLDGGALDRYWWGHGDDNEAINGSTDSQCCCWLPTPARDDRHSAEASWRKGLQLDWKFTFQYAQ